MELKHDSQASGLGVLPAEWDVRPLEKLVDPQRPIGYGIVQTGRPVHGGVKCVRVVDIQNGRVNPEELITTSLEISAAYRRTLLARGDLIIALRGKIGEPALVDDGIVGANLTRGVALLSGSDAYDGEFLCQYLSSSASKQVFLRNLNGSALQEIPIATLRRIPAPVPPLSEQKAIAAALNDVDALLGALDQLIAKKRDLKQAAMQQLLTGQTRLPGFGIDAECKHTEAGTVPVDWEVRPLLSAVRIANGQVDPRTEPYRSMTLVAPDHIESATGRLLARQSAADQKAISGKYLFSAGDIIYSKIRPYLRKAIVADFDGLCSADMYPLRPAAGVSARYMLAVLLGHRFSGFAESVSVRSGMPKINRAELAQYSVALPGRQEQDVIAEVLTDMDAELNALEQRRDKTRLLKQGMMQELLTGRTRLV